MENCHTALVTPFTNGKVNYAEFTQLIEFQKKNAVTRMLVSGTTGESPTTTEEEKSKLLASACAISGLDIIAGCASNSTEHSLYMAKDAHEQGIRRILLVDCYYNGPSSYELAREYYAPLAQSFPDTKFIAYVIPGRTGCELSVEDLVWLHTNYPNIDTVKEAAGNLERMKKTRAHSKSISIMSGDDDITYTMMTDPAIQSTGVISVMSNLAPHAVQRLCDAAKAHGTGAHALAQELAPLMSLVTVKAEGQKFRNPVPIKTAMAGLGMITYEARRPLGRMTKTGTEIVRNTLRQLWKNSPWVLEPIAEFYDVDIDKRLKTDSYWVNY